MDAIMATGTFRLKGRQLYAQSFAERRVRNVQEIATRSGMAYPTAHRWIEKPHELSSISLENLAGFLVDGLGLTPDEVEGLRFGDVFEFVPMKTATE
jgi:hypothetical protein